jgi:hypothetical protein
MTTGDLLKEGIAALNAGRKAKAHNLLMQVVQQDERNEMAWLWLSGAVDTDEERRICLENVLAINPNNGVARRGLDSLIAREGVRSLSTVSSPAPSVEPAVIPHEQPIQPPAETSAPVVTQRKKRKVPPRHKKATSKRKDLMIGLGVGGVVLVCVALAGIWLIGSLNTSPERAYAAGARKSLELLERWMEGAVADWADAVWNFQLSRPSATLYNVDEISAKGSKAAELARQVVDEGFEVKAAFVALDPPPEMRATQQQIVDCIDSILSQAQKPVIDCWPSEPPLLEPVRRQIEEFIAQH